jgi:D-alanyl-D-alanine carboxypeptidase/D-alanyl-D-alanine-endopeptidase (penicillin-binding protein 4)
LLRTIALATALVWLGASSAPAASPAGSGDPLARALDRALGSAGLRGARVGALVVRADDGRVLYARDADTALVPASNLKVLTAVAALSALGPAHRFKTRVLADARPDASGAVGSLYVEGGGDPALTSEQCWRLAADLHARGLRRVRGDLVLDASRFDTRAWHPDWGAPTSRAYHAPVSALSANYGSFEVWAAPGAAAGEKVRVRVDPPLTVFELVVKATTAPRGKGPSLQVTREGTATGERVVVTGSLPAGHEPRRFALSVTDPVRYAGSLLRTQLEAVGIAVEGVSRAGRAPEGSAELHEFEGLPLADVMRLFMKWSNNAIGEILIKELGAVRSGGPGSWENGVAAARAELARLGLESESLRWSDGSGLSVENRVSPRLLVEALRIGERSFEFGPELLSALPIAGADGTLRRRAPRAGGAVRAKTGLLSGVNGLTGVARDPRGRDLIFCVLANGVRGGATPAMRALDDFMTALASVASEPATGGSPQEPAPRSGSHDDAGAAAAKRRRAG